MKRKMNPLVAKVTEQMEEEEEEDSYEENVCDHLLQMGSRGT